MDEEEPRNKKSPFLQMLKTRGRILVFKDDSDVGDIVMLVT